ncbi:MAG TPA: hypothetical protein VFS80_04650 [Burkholderiales bacterium]|nr:hypothetical protein [Burkholderiales bacterium]
MQDELVRRLLPFVGPQFRRQVLLHVPQLARREILQPLQLDQGRAAQACRKLLRALVALDQRALNVLLLREGGQGERHQHDEPHVAKAFCERHSSRTSSLLLVSI